MNPRRLHQLAEDPSVVAPADYGDLAREARDVANHTLQQRYTVLGECLDLAEGFWAPGDEGAVTTAFAVEVNRLWLAYLPGCLRATSEEEGVALAMALREELRVLGVNDPLTYEGEAGSP